MIEYAEFKNKMNPVNGMGFIKSNIWLIHFGWVGEQEL